MEVKGEWCPQRGSVPLPHISSCTSLPLAVPELYQGFPGGTVVKNLPVRAGDAGLIPASGRSPGVGNDNPFHYSCLGNAMDRGAWRATVHGVRKSWTGLSLGAQAHTSPVLLYQASDPVSELFL